MDKLKPIAGYRPPNGPVVLLIMDGIGEGTHGEGDLVNAAWTPNLDWLRENCPGGRLQAHGTAVGLPDDDDMGNSEVGHNAIGAGRVFDQGARRVNKALQDGTVFEEDTWKRLIGRCRERNSCLHFIGLLSDGNVHSHIDQLKALIRRAAREDVPRIRIHALFDGRDVPPVSAHEYLADLESFLAEMREQGADINIASGGGRMKITMDRYEADWEMVQRGWDIHVHGKGRAFDSAMEALETFRAENEDILDQDLPGFVVARDGKPVGRIEDGDSVVFFNYRGDRAIEISRAFEEDNLDHIDRGRRPDVEFAGMMEYDGDLHIPKQFLVAPPQIDRTVGEYLSRSGITQLAISETQKFGHVTYFFNGNRSGKFNAELETYIEITSDRVPFEERPWMKAAEITDRVVRAIGDNEARFIRLNYPNGDMVGHTGVIPAVKIAVETVDLCLGRVMQAVKRAGGILVVSADHGNADNMYPCDKKTGAVLRDENGRPKSKTSHSLNPVPAAVYDPAGSSGARPAGREQLGIASLGATCLTLLGYEPPEDYAPSIVDVDAPQS